MHRWFDLAGTDNTRDLGGLPTSDGRLTRSGVLLRSDTLQELTAADVARLREVFGLRAVLDLRAPVEAAREGRGPLEYEDVAYHNLSFLPGEWIMPDDPRFPAIVKDLDSVDRVEHYLDYLRLAGNAVAGSVRLLAQPATGPALFHCAAGKDRTGVLSALLLGIVGVVDEAIIEDYALTNERIARVDARLARRPSYNRPEDPLTIDKMSCRPEVMRGFLGGVAEIWGGPAAWARAAGVPEEDLRSLRSLLVG
ncbi:tyrosine-protein phosphatase [Parafrankia discariae]|uniref:tyrosine-protein phosphatase n=1 Tax=Parafrankia discariae TaxID=365528 RepID=UPI0003784DC8|nr:tyrosine-protein phosphatase [Parafrankia discariae]